MMIKDVEHNVGIIDLLGQHYVPCRGFKAFLITESAFKAGIKEILLFIQMDIFPTL